MDDSPAPPEKPAIAMEEPQPGDFWTYKIRDEISGNVSSVRKFVVTEVTPTEVSVSVRVEGKDRSWLNVYDRSWNLKITTPWTYQPHDGSGILAPLKLDASWSAEGEGINAAAGNIWKLSSKSKVIGQETITTEAGTFDTFKIERSVFGHSNNDPTRKQETTEQTWYAPVIDHWVKRVSVSRMNKHLMVNNTIELVDYGRKQ